MDMQSRIYKYEVWEDLERAKDKWSAFYIMYRFKYPLLHFMVLGWRWRYNDGCFFETIDDALKTVKVLIHRDDYVPEKSAKHIKRYPL